MILATELKAGVTFLLDNTPHKVQKYTHQKIARGGGTVKVSLINLETGSSIEKTFQSTAKFEEVSTLKKPLQFLYTDSETATFMDPDTYEQVEIPTKVLGRDLKYIKEGQIVDILFFEEKALSVEIPPKVVLRVEKTAPGVKGNSATNIYKPAELENGISIKVPLFISPGDKIRVDTRDGSYVERVKE